MTDNMIVLHAHKHACMSPSTHTCWLRPPACLSHVYIAKSVLCPKMQLVRMLFWMLQSQHQLHKWEVRQPCSAPTPAQVLGLTPLPDPSSPADALETSMLLRPRAECAGA